jgi:DHA2 family multidrug resistance protein-like MFS transporter
MKKELRILLWASAMFMLAGGLFGPLYAVFVEDIGGDLLTAGGAWAIYLIVAGIVVYFISRWEDHVKHQEKLVVWGFVLSVIGFAGYLFIREPWHLFLVQVIFGFGEAIGTPAFDGLYSKHLDKGKFASEWGLWESMDYIIAGIAALIGGLVANYYGFRLLFVIMLILSIIGVIISVFLVYRKKIK